MLTSPLRFDDESRNEVVRILQSDYGQHAQDAIRAVYKISEKQWNGLMPLGPDRVAAEVFVSPKLWKGILSVIPPF